MRRIEIQLSLSFFIITFYTYAQEGGGRMEINFKEGMTVNVPDRDGKQGKDIKNTPDNPPTPAPVAVVVKKELKPPPPGVTLETKETLEMIKKFLKGMSIVTSMLKSSPLLGLITNSAEEQLISSSLMVTPDDWQKLSQGLTNLKKSENALIGNNIDHTIFDLERTQSEYRKTNIDDSNLQKEIDFWIKFKDNLPKYCLTPDVSGNLIKERITYNYIYETRIYSSLTCKQSNFIQNGIRGIKITPYFSIKNAEGILLEIIVYFYYENGDPVKDINGAFNTIDGNACVVGNIEPCCLKTVYNDNLYLFMPFDEFEIDPHGTYYFKYLFVVRKKDKVIGKTDWNYFNIKYDDKPNFRGK